MRLDEGLGDATALAQCPTDAVEQVAFCLHIEQAAMVCGELVFHLERAGIT